MTRPQLVDGWRIEITIRDGVDAVVSRAEIGRVVAAALAAAGAPKPATLAVILTDDAEIEELNVAHLGHDGPTDVLSFPLLAPDEFSDHAGRAPSMPGPPPQVAAAPFVLPPGARLGLGDIVVSMERAVAQAAEGRGGQTSDIRWSAADELRLLLTHGTLHICGWDHAEPVEEAAMRDLERDLLGHMPT